MVAPVTAVVDVATTVAAAPTKQYRALHPNTIKYHLDFIMKASFDIKLAFVINHSDTSSNLHLTLYFQDMQAEKQLGNSSKS